MANITTKIIGTAYEYYVIDMIKLDYDNVWHWNNCPEYILYKCNIIRDYDIYKKYKYDLGADLVAIKDNNYYFIQCKNFKNTICMDALAGFYFFIHEYNLNGILYYNGTLSQRVIDLSTNKIPFIHLPFNNQMIQKNLNKNIELQPREYQLKAYEYLKNIELSILSFPCGMGKTFVASLLASDYDNIIILSPLRSLAQQTLLMMNNTLNYEPILISMDGSLNVNTIKTFIGNKNIISVTYDSVEIVLKIINLLNNVFIIIDEFHNLSNNNINNLNNPINKLISLKYNKLYISATPNLDIKYDKIFSYSWLDAIKNNYICDFKIIIPDKDISLDHFNNFILNISNNIDNESFIKKCFFILKCMLYYGSRKCICYFTSTENIDIFQNILQWMIKFMNINVDYWTMTYKTTLMIRNKIFDEFKKSTNISLLLSVHILDEGINIEECDSVFIIKPNDNIVNIVQRMSRANRITKNKKKCYIYLWCSKKKTDVILNYILNKTENITINKIYQFNPEKVINKNYIVETCNEIIKPIIFNGLFIYNEYKLDVALDNKNIIWFNANNLCEMLKYKDFRSALKQHVEKNNKTYFKNINHKFQNIKNKNAQPNSIYIDEIGMYSLLFKSRLNFGKKIREWIIGDVLINIKKYM